MKPKILCLLNHPNWRETLLSNDLKYSKWMRYLLVPIVYILPKKYSFLINTFIQTKLLDYLEFKYGAKTYGGFLENRADLIGFLEAECNGRNMTHLGIDINNIPSKTLIKVPCDVEVVHVMKDFSQINGWGGRLIMKMTTEFKNSKYLLYGHLSHDLPCVGDVFKKDDIIAKLGDVNENGGWFPHLHVQCITQKFYDKYIDKLDELDGYLFNDVDYTQYVSDPTLLVMH